MFKLLLILLKKIFESGLKEGKTNLMKVLERFHEQENSDSKIKVFQFIKELKSKETIEA